MDWDICVCKDFRTTDLKHLQISRSPKQSFCTTVCLGLIVGELLIRCYKKCSTYQPLDIFSRISTSLASDDHSNVELTKQVQISITCTISLLSALQDNHEVNYWLEYRARSGICLSEIDPIIFRERRLTQASATNIRRFTTALRVFWASTLPFETTLGYDLQFVGLRCFHDSWTSR